MKIRDRQINIFNRLEGCKEMGREVIAQSPVSNSQMQPRNNNNKWVINLPYTPLSKPKSPCYQKDSIMQWP